VKTQRLGYPKDSKIVILNIDDLGNKLVNTCVPLLENCKIPKSFSIMTEEAGFEEAVELVKEYSLDVGLHLDPYNVDDIEKQIIKCLEHGLSLSHLDSHKHKIYENRILLDKAIEMSHKYQIPLGLVHTHRSNSLLQKYLLKNNQLFYSRLPFKSIMIDDYCFTPNYLDYYAFKQEPENVNESFFNLIKKIHINKITVIALHPLLDTNRLPEWNDLLLLTDIEVCLTIQKLCCLTTWKELVSRHKGLPVCEKIML
jgi:predicted glycoside hydrolase/deacetylase ChbG (UPF0249 family)